MVAPDGCSCEGATLRTLYGEVADLTNVVGLYSARSEFYGTWRWQFLSRTRGRYTLCEDQGALFDDDSTPVQRILVE